VAEIGAMAGFPAGERAVHEGAAPQFGKTPQPRLQRQIRVDIAGSREMAAIVAPEIAGGRDFYVYRAGRLHDA
ncbi:MAG: hypothetical protein L7F78_26605, partial [Syntrophales bacterium LBB04]|nr:hypothetical protein [Syntrophales bacterium LBB04]